MSSSLNQCSISGPEKFFGCEYCPLEFKSRQDRIQHTATHFKSKSCNSCHKLLLRINGDWYELHASPPCDTEDDAQNHSDETCTSTNRINVREFDFVSTNTKQAFKTEANDYGSSDEIDKDGSVSDAVSVLGPNIEMNSLPPIVQSLAKLKTNLTISRTTIKKSSIVKTQDTIPQRNKWENVRPPVRKQVRRVSNKTVFMDHRPQGSCVCDVCNKTLRNFSTLRNHIIHQHCSSGLRARVSCVECGQTFATPGNLKLHQRLHLKDKAFVCTYCGRGFNQIGGLKEHTNRHTGERPHKCTYCGKTFFRKTTLVAHTRVHTGVKPFKCKIENCDRAYMFDIDLKRHKYSVHGIFTKKHICQICNKVYPENKLLKKHLESHSTAQYSVF